MYNTAIVDLRLDANGKGSMRGGQIAHLPKYLITGG
jgi:hypothetical protein